MNADRGKSQSWISGGMAIALVVLSALSMLAFLALSAYAPELRTESNGRANALSKSAIGFAGLRVLLEETGTAVSVSRSRTPSRAGLLILTPDADASSSDIAALVQGRLSLIVLPKWEPVGNPFHSGWVVKTRTYDPADIAALLKQFDDSTKVAQGSKGPLQTFGEPKFGASPWTRKMSVAAWQTVRGKKWEPDVTDSFGNAVLVHLKGTETYVFAEPDLLNTQALRDVDLATGAIALVRQLENCAGGVTFDVTLSGFSTSPSLLRAAFAPPFLGATLCAIPAAALLAFHAFSRFGTPRVEERTFAFGKRSLADNTAGLIRMMGRQPAMAPRYGLATRKLAGKILRGPRGEEYGWLDAVERSVNVSPSFAELMTEAREVQTDSGLLKVAAKLHEWRLRITHERS